MESQKREDRDLKTSETVLTDMSEEVVYPTFHSGSRVLANKGFNTTPPFNILANI